MLVVSETLVAGRYRLLERVGAGSMGEVWRAHDDRLDREVAVKLLDLSAAPDPSIAERFRREAVATAQLNHPNIVSVFDAGTDGTRAYLVMTLLRGRTIAELVRTQGPMPLDHALNIALQVVSALREAHRHGLVHRDIKPANVIVQGDKATVVDFGIAQLSGLDASLTATHAVIGSAAYMSPEHAVGRRVGPPSDLYGIGCLLMTMLTGQPPFTGESAVAVANQQVSAEAPALSERIRTPRALDQLVSALLSKDPAQRPDAAATLLALRGVATHPTADLVGPSPRAAATATVVIPQGPSPSSPPRPNPTAVMPAVAPPPTRTSVMPVAPSPVAPAPVPATRRPSPQPSAARPTPPPVPVVARRRHRGLRVVIWLVLILLLGGAAYALGTQAGAITALVETPEPVSTDAPPSSATPKPTTAKPTTAKPTTAAPTTTAAATVLQLAVQGVSQVLAGLPAGDSKDALVADWSSTGAAVLQGDHPNDQLDRFSTSVQKEVRKGGLSIPQGIAILGAVEAVRAAL